MTTRRSGYGTPISTVSDPTEIYQRAKEEGRRRLTTPGLEQATTAFIAGVTIVFGIVAHAVVVALVTPDVGSGVAQVAGALAFGIGLVFLVIGRSELFAENIFDPVAEVLHRRTAGIFGRLGRLWVLSLVFNLAGGAVLLLIMLVDGALPSGAPSELVHVAEEVVHKKWSATLARAVLAGALVALLSYMLKATTSAVAKIALAYLVGFFLALGPFDHVVVSGLQVLYGVWSTGSVTYVDWLANLGLAAVGNVAGALVLITFTHAVQAKSG